jgi:hypothetical protein
MSRSTASLLGLEDESASETSELREGLGRVLSAAYEGNRELLDEYLRRYNFTIEEFLMIYKDSLLRYVRNVPMDFWRKDSFVSIIDLIYTYSSDTEVMSIISYITNPEQISPVPLMRTNQDFNSIYMVGSSYVFTDRMIYAMANELVFILSSILAQEQLFEPRAANMPERVYEALNALFKSPDANDKLGDIISGVDHSVLGKRLADLLSESPELTDMVLKYREALSPHLGGEERVYQKIEKRGIDEEVEALTKRLKTMSK